MTTKSSYNMLNCNFWQFLLPLKVTENKFTSIGFIWTTPNLYTSFNTEPRDTAQMTTTKHLYDQAPSQIQNILTIFKRKKL